MKKCPLKQLAQTIKSMTCGSFTGVQTSCDGKDCQWYWKCREPEPTVGPPDDYIYIHKRDIERGAAKVKEMVIPPIFDDGPIRIPAIKGIEDELPSICNQCGFIECACGTLASSAP